MVVGSSSGNLLCDASEQEDRELHEELEAIFDDNEEEESLENFETQAVLTRGDSSGVVVPASPEKISRHEKRPSSILDALIARKESVRLTSHAAAIAKDAVALVDGVRNSNAADQLGQGLLIPKRSSNKCEGAQQVLSNTLGRNRTELIRAEARNLEISQEQTRKARNAFRVVGAVRQQSGAPTHDIATRNVSNMSLLSATVDAARLNAIFEYTRRVDISELTTKIDDVRGGRLGEWVLFGCIVKRHGKREAKDGSKFAVWSLCNMPRWSLKYQNSIMHKATGCEDSGSNGSYTNNVVKNPQLKGIPPVPTSITLLVFGDAFTAWHTLVEGNAVALRNPTILPPRGSEFVENNTKKPSERGGPEWCGHCIRVSRSDQIVTLGTCADYHTCTEPKGDGEVCGAWYDANRSTMCSLHLRRKRQRLTLGTRMDVNNAERPGPRADVMRFARNDGSTIDISRASTHLNNIVSNKTDALHSVVNATDIDDRLRKAEADAKRIAALKKPAHEQRHASTVNINGDVGKAAVTNKNDIGGSGSGTIAKLPPAASRLQMRALAASKPREGQREPSTSRILKRGREQYAQALKEELDRTNKDLKKLTQQKLDAAIEVLRKVGYSVTTDGDLLAPPTRGNTTKSGLTICKGNVPSVRSKTSFQIASTSVSRGHNDKLCLSDESGSL